MPSVLEYSGEDDESAEIVQATSAIVHSYSTVLTTLPLIHASDDARLELGRIPAVDEVQSAVTQLQQALEDE